MPKPDDCGPCILKSRCTTGSRRHVSRHFDEDALNRMKERATPEMMRIRRSAVEHPFGAIKRMMAGGRFLTRNLKGTRTEMVLSILAYSIMRTINTKPTPAYTKHPRQIRPRSKPRPQEVFTQPAETAIFLFLQIA
ncbi:transposase [Rhizobium sp. 3T7]|uniref:transposase n=1 Tax=Rhizobium sp. 3T7 TaxID=2874922 RepID=UPI001CC90DFF|nr:transposase [Rhizobium sp. 3T7]